MCTRTCYHRFLQTGLTMCPECSAEMEADDSNKNAMSLLAAADPKNDPSHREGTEEEYWEHLGAVAEVDLTQD